MKLCDEKNLEQSSPIHLEVGVNNTIAIHANEKFRWMRFDNSGVQSVCDLATPWHPVAPYCLSMLSGLCLRPGPSRVLNLGLGGGTFERFFREKLPDTTVTTVEPCPTVARLAKRFFDLSEDTEIIEDSGWDFVKSCQEKFDIIFIDMFDENGHLECLGDAKFYSDLHLIVAHSGLIIIDIAPADEDSLLAILLSIRPIFNHVQLSTEPEASNMILICSRAPFPGLAQTLILAEKLNNTLGINFSEALQKFSKLPAPVQYQ